MSDPMVPRAAATILPLRDGPGGLEVLMVRRNPASEFVGGAHVFPGGALEVEDGGLGSLVTGLDDATASRILGVASGGLASFVAAARELFEEAGLLLVDATAADPDALGAWQTAMNERRSTLAEVLASEGLRLDLGQMRYIGHWVTPLGQPRRYDTRFFLVPAPGEQVAAHDRGETVAHLWVRPVDALAAGARGSITLILPTIQTLRQIALLPDVAGALAWAAGLGPISRIEPHLRERAGRAWITLPGEPGYDD